MNKLLSTLFKKNFKKLVYDTKVFIWFCAIYTDYPSPFLITVGELTMERQLHYMYIRDQRVISESCSGQWSSEELNIELKNCNSC